MVPSLDETEEERRRREDPGIKTYEDVGGVPIYTDRHGVHLDEERAENRLLHKVQMTISQSVFGCVFTVVFGFAAMVIIVAVVAYVGWEVVRMSGSPHAATPAEAGAWDGSAPFVCGGSDAVTLDHPAARFDSGVAVTASGNCRLELVAPDLAAPTALLANGNAVVTVRGGHLAGTDASIRAEGLSKVTTLGATLDGPIRKAGLATIASGAPPP